MPLPIPSQRPCTAATNSPTFLAVMGATKAGTTSLQAFLAKHPDISMSPIKETNHFCPDLWPFMGHVPRLPRSRLERLLSDQETLHCALIDDASDFETLFPHRHNRHYFGEASPAYLRSIEAPRRIHEAHPNARLIMVLRDPIQRALSHYRMELRDARVPDAFERCIDEEFDTRSAGSRPPYGILESGCYGQALERLLRYFPRDQILLLDFSALRDSPALAKRLGAFLSLDPDGFSRPLEHINQWGDPRHALLNRLLSNFGLKAFIRTLIPQRLIEVMKPFYYGDPRQSAELDPRTEQQLIDFYQGDLGLLISLTEVASFPWISRYCKMPD